MDSQIQTIVVASKGRLTERQAEQVLRSRYEAQRRQSAADEARRLSTETYFAIGDVGAHEGYACGPYLERDAWTPENPDGWTYQDVTGSHGQILYEGPDKAAAEAVLARFLRCDAAEHGRRK